MKTRKYILPLLLIFLFTNAFFLTGKSFLEKKGFELNALIIGNLVLFAAGLISFLIVQKGITGKNNAAFIRRVYGGFVGKLMVILGGVIIYIMVAKVNKPAIMVLMFLYLLYTVAEVSALMRLNSAQKNA
jgi:hypothetical protein